LGVLGCQPACGTLGSTDAPLSQAIALVKEKALNAPSVDWPVIETEAAAKFLASPDEPGRTAAIRHVLAALKDGHSFYRPPASVPTDATRLSRPAPLPIALTDVTTSKYGRLAINSWSGERASMLAATTLVRKELRKALSVDDCGLIVDVSSNSGGNMWPMMGGLAPVYEDGVLETFQNRTGAPGVVSVQSGVLRMNESAFPQIDGVPKLDRKPRFVAVILGKRTASSGEILALGFKHQENARFFGQATAGATTANWSTGLSNGGLLAITTSRILDRTGAVHTGPLVPDEVSDQPVHAAEAWLTESCR
jgi:hypothetical protein